MSKNKKNKHPDWQLSGGERKWYYISETGRYSITQIIGGFMSTFLLFQGINAAAVATAVLLVKIVDALDDVVFGFLVDKLDPTRWKWARKIAGKGKYMPWYRLTFWTFPLATIFFFLMPKSMPDAAKIIWFTVFYLLYDLTCTLSEVPMNSLVVTLTENKEERDQIITVKGVAATLSIVLLVVVVQFLISEKVGLPITWVCVIACLLFFAMMFPMTFKVREHNTELKNAPEEKHTENYSLKDMVSCVFTNKYIFIFFAALLLKVCLQTGTAVGTFASFYILHDSNVTSYITLIALVPGLAISLCGSKLAAKFGNRNLMAGLFFFTGIGSLVLYFNRNSPLGIYVAVGSFFAMGNALFVVAQNYIAPSTVEYTRYKTGKDCSAIFFSLQSFVNKATVGIASSLGLFILSISGWKDVQAESFAELAASGIQQSEQALNALWSCTNLIPAIGSILGGIVMLFYSLKDKDAELMAKCNAGLITREECEAALSRKY